MIGFINLIIIVYPLVKNPALIDHFQIFHFFPIQRPQIIKMVILIKENRIQERSFFSCRFRLVNPLNSLMI